MNRSKQDVLDAIQRHRVVAVVRTQDGSSLVDVAKALSDGGISLIEITLTVPGALEIIRQAKDELKGREICLGAGTVRDPQTAKAAIDAGAEFIVAPTLNLETVKYCNEQETAVAPGAFSPTEVETAWQAGADMVKIFPANIGGPQYFKDLRGPLPGIRLMPTGNVDFKTAPQYLAAGAIAVGVGGVLFGPDLIARRDFPQITENARKLVACIRQT